MYAAYAHQCLARLAAATGDEGRCQDYAARATRLVERHDNAFGRLYVQSALGLLELGLGRTDAAIEQLARPPGCVARGGSGAEHRPLAARPDRGVRARRAPRHALAALDQLERQPSAPRSLGARRGGPLPRPAVRRRRRRALSRVGGVARGRRRRLTLPARTCAAESACAATAVAATRVRRCSRAAEGFETLGAAPWAARARAELRASGVTRRRTANGSRGGAHRPRTPGRAHRRRGREQSGDGGGAVPLAKTIEYHLASIFRKLGVRSRTELAATRRPAVARPEPPTRGGRRRGEPEFDAAVELAPRRVVLAADFVRRHGPRLAEAERREVTEEVRVAALEHVDHGLGAALGEALVERVAALGVRVAFDHERLRQVGMRRAVAQFGDERFLAAGLELVAAVVEEDARGEGHVRRDGRRGRGEHDLAAAAARGSPR